MAGIFKQDDFQKTALRVPKGLHAKIIEAAKKNSRTMNAEIVSRLEKSFGIEDEQEEYNPPPGTTHAVMVTKEEYDALEKLMDQIRKSNVELSKLKRGNPFSFKDDEHED